MPQSRLRELEEPCALWTLCVDLSAQGPHDARAHLCGCFPGEGDRKNLFRLVDFGEQAQQALRQYGRLARAGGCLQQDRESRIGGLLTRAIIRSDTLNHRVPLR